MKTIKYISILVLSACMAALSSCAEDEIVKKGTPGDGHTLRLELTADANRVISPLSKANAEDAETIQDLTLLIYDAQTNELIRNESKYISSGTELTDLSKVSTETEKASATFTFTDIEPGNKVAYVVANAGNLLSNSTLDISTEDALKNCKFGLKDDVNPQFVMFADGQSFNVEGSATINSSLKRIYAMVTVQMEFTGMNEGVRVVPQSVQLKHIPTGGSLGVGNKIQSDNECLIDGEKIAKGSNDRFLAEGHAGATPLFMYENIQPDGTNAGDERTKTPYGITATDNIISIIEQDRKCSYIELVADYYKGGVNTGKVTYRFFLGEDALTNFEVKRNVHYKVTLTLTGNGGIDEATWRVIADLKDEISIPDVYIGYRKGATTVLKVTGSKQLIGQVQVAAGSANNIAITNRDQNAGTIEVTALKTNVHDYSSYVYELTVPTSGGNSKTTKVIQVPRLVDPVAIYKAAQNDDEKFIEVRAYDPDVRAYQPLVSEGPWSATIQSSSTDNCWFEIYTEDGDKLVNTVGQSITGEGEVKFWYKPLSKNNSQERLSNKISLDNEESDKARYGVILVKYHNEMCPHEIYLRQGYQPTTMNNTTWSMFNCIGLDNNGDPLITDYPTETGWLFKGGSNIGMNPFTPVYGVQEKLPLSNGQTSAFWNVDVKYTDWVPGFRSHQERNNAQQGPCPKGYRLASGADFDDLSKNSFVTTGYVYDDDPVAGWQFGANGAEIDNSNHCNPAKGTLFISNDGSGRNIFFTHGKGVLIEHKDNNLINEIGIGHRAGTKTQFDKITIEGNKVSTYYGNGGFLMNDEVWTDYRSQSYGAWYWGASLFNWQTVKNRTARFSRVGLEFDIFTTEPVHVDVADNTTITQEDRYGVTGYAHGSFVRCVRGESSGGGGQEKPTDYITFRPRAEFEYISGGDDYDISGFISITWPDDDGILLKVNNGQATHEIELPNDSNIKFTLSYVGKYNITYTATGVTISDLQDDDDIELKSWH